MKTAVEWLIDEMLKQGYFDVNKQLTFTNLDHLQHQAKEMENKQQEDFAYWCEWRNDRAFKTYDELLKIYKNETKR